MFGKWEKVWVSKQGEQLPAIIKNIDDDDRIYYLYVFYKGCWHDDIATKDKLSKRTSNLSSQIFAVRKHLLDGITKEYNH